MSKFGNVLVTGGTGLLGSELVKQLLESSDTRKVICLIRDFLPQSRFYSESLSKKVIVVRGDIRDQSLLERTLNEYEIQTVFHLAAQTLVGQANRQPTETFDVNIRGTWALLEACRRIESVGPVVIASSDKAYGNLRGESYDESYPLHGDHPYDVSKSCTDLISQCYAKSYGMNICVTRCGNFFGPGDLNESRLFPSVILSVLREQSPVIRSDGKFIRDYIYVADGAAAYRHLAEKMLSGKFSGEAFNFSYGLRLSVTDVVEKIVKQMNSNLKPTILNQAKNEIPVQCLNSEKAQRLLDWKPRFGFDEGIDKTVEWYRKQFSSGLT